MRAISLLLLVGCATPPPTPPVEDLTAWTDIADDGTVSSALHATVVDVVAADARTADGVVVAAHHARDDGLFMRDELLVTLHRPDDDRRCNTLAALQLSDDGWHVVQQQRVLDDNVEIEAATTCADAVRAIDLVNAVPETSALALRPLWVGPASARGRVARSTCTTASQLVVELEHATAMRSDLHAAACVDDDRVQLTSWAPIWPTVH